MPEKKVHDTFARKNDQNIAGSRNNYAGALRGILFCPKAFIGWPGASQPVRVLRLCRNYAGTMPETLLAAHDVDLDPHLDLDLDVVLCRNYAGALRGHKKHAST